MEPLYVLGEDEQKQINRQLDYYDLIADRVTYINDYWNALY